MNASDETMQNEDNHPLPPPVPLPDTDADWTEPGWGEGTATIGPGLQGGLAANTAVEQLTAGPPSTSQHGTTIPGYRLQARLGQGGMGTVYLAIDEQLGRLVAIKVLSESANATPRMRERFLAESKTVAQLQHPNIAQLYSAGESGQQPYLVMEYVEGTTLAETLTETGEDPRRAAELIRTLADAMQYCHERHIVHRDLKPSNVLIDLSGRPKIADFGVAKLLQTNSGSTVTGEIVGTPSFMSPEQASGLVKGLGPASDVYSLGAILYKLLTGRAPFVADNPMQTLMSVLTDEVVAPRTLQRQIPKDLETICLKCLEKKASKRYATAAELSAELTRFLNDEPIQARPSGWLDRTLKWTRRHPGRAAIVGAVAIGIVGSFAGLTWHTRQLQSQLTKNQRLAERGSELSLWLINDHIRELRGLRGSTPVQAAVVERVQRYLDENLDDAEANPKLLRRLGVAYMALGDVLGNPNYANLGRLEDAEESYSQAIEILEEALRLDASDRPSRLLMINGRLKQADLVGQRKGMPASQSLLEAASTELQPFTDSPDDEVLLLRISINQRRHDVAFQQNQFSDALDCLDACQRDLDAMSHDEKWQADRLHQQVLIHERRGTTWEAQGEYEQAAEAYRDGLDLARDALQQRPDDPESMIRYATLVVSLADCLTFLGELEAALMRYEESLQFRRELAQADPQNQAYQQQLATSLSRVASGQELLGELESAGKTLEQAIEVRRQCYERARDDRELKKALAIDLLSKGRLELQQQRHAEATAALQEQSELLADELQSDQPSPEVLNIAAQGQFHSALISFEKLMPRLNTDPNFSTEWKEYQAVMRRLDKSLALFQQIETQGEMTAAQKAFQESVQQTKQAMLEMVQQLAPGV